PTSDFHTTLVSLHYAQAFRLLLKTSVERNLTSSTYFWRGFASGRARYLVSREINRDGVCLPACLPACRADFLLRHLSLCWLTGVFFHPK
ncbi:hypothetical protein J4Q44_G00340720, partial [Coregonus suidteri]